MHSFRLGDRVFGRSEEGLAEYACLGQNKAALIPETVSFEAASAIPLASVTALIALREKGRVRSGQKVLINGASGGIGSFAVQLARSYGAEVTGVCSSENLDFVRSLGAQNTVDYMKEDFANLRRHYNLVVDLIGNRPIADFSRILQQRGRCVLIGYSDFKNMFWNLIKAVWKPKTSDNEFIVINAEVLKQDLEYLGRIVSDGALNLL